MRNLTRIGFALIFALSGLVAGSINLTRAATPPAYTVTDLGIFEVPLTPELSGVAACATSGWGFIKALNNAGVATGSLPKDDFLKTPIVFSDGKLKRYKTGGIAGEAYDINASGTIVGTVFNASGGPPDYPCPTALGASPAMWVKGKLTRLPTPEGYTDGSVYAVNDAGVMLGVVFKTDYSGTEWLTWEGDTMTVIQDGACDDTTKQTQIQALNNQGVAAGVYCGDPAEWNGTTRTMLDPHAGTGITTVRAINDDGVVVGHWQDSSTNQLFPLIWNDGKVAELSLPEGETVGFAAAVNAGGTIVGGKYLWIDGVVTDLNTTVSGFAGTIDSCFALNDNNQIACHGTVDGVRHALLLNPST